MPRERATNFIDINRAHRGYKNAPTCALNYCRLSPLMSHQAKCVLLFLQRGGLAVTQAEVVLCAIARSIGLRVNI